MGLDITAYQNIKKIDCVFNADQEPIDPATREPIDGEWFQVTINPHFADRAIGLEDSAVYRYDESMRFRAGSYSGYNTWREILAKLAGYPAVESTEYGRTSLRHDAGAWEADGGPFWELIHFSDCEGDIGPEVSTKLAKDFTEFQDKADAEDGDFFKTLYTQWRKAFEMASQNGCVSFH